MVDLLCSWKCSQTQTLTLFFLVGAGVRLVASSGFLFRLIRCEKVCTAQIFRRFGSPQRSGELTIVCFLLGLSDAKKARSQ